jgi:hypothetical protein
LKLWKPKSLPRATRRSKVVAEDHKEAEVVAEGHKEGKVVAEGHTEGKAKVVAEGHKERVPRARGLLWLEPGHRRGDVSCEKKN